MALPADLEQTERILAARQHHAEFLTHHPEYDRAAPNAHVHPVFAGILNAFAGVATHAAEHAQDLDAIDKRRDPKRFSGAAPTHYGSLA